MLKRTSLLQIDSHSLPVPTGSPTIKFSDVESSDSGADEMGVYHREVLRYGVLTASLEYSYLDNADCAYLLGLLQNKTTFQFTCPVASDAADVTHHPHLLLLQLRGGPAAAESGRLAGYDAGNQRMLRGCLNG